MSSVPHGYESRMLDRIGDMGCDRLHVGDVFVADQHHRGTADLTKKAGDGYLENFLLLGACLPGTLLHLVGAEDHLGRRRPDSRVDLVRGAIDRKSTRLNSSHSSISY